MIHFCPACAILILYICFKEVREVHGTERAHKGTGTYGDCLLGIQGHFSLLDAHNIEGIWLITILRELGTQMTTRMEAEGESTVTACGVIYHL